MKEKRTGKARDETPRAGEAESHRTRAARALSKLRPLELPALSAYLSAPIAVLVAVCLQYAVLADPTNAPFVLLFASVAICSWVAGLGPGLLAVVLAAAAGNYLFLESHRVASLSVAELTVTGLFVASAAIVALLCGSLRQAFLRLQRSVAAQRRAEAALRESEVDLNRAQAVALTGSWRLDVRRNELRWSDETHRLFGVPKGTALTYESFLAAVHPEDRESVDRKWTAAAMHGEKYEIEHRIIARGEVKWVRERSELEFEGDGKFVSGFGTVQDITERKQIDEALRYQRDLNLAVTQSAAEAIIVTDEEGRVTLLNPEAERMFGSSREEIKGQVLHDIVHPHHAGGNSHAASDCPIARIYQTGEAVRDHGDIFFRKDGSALHVACSSAPLEVEGKRFGAVLMVRDVTEQALATDERERLLAALEERNQRKNEFLALLSHELRNPLTPIRNCLAILNRATPGGEQAQWAHTVLGRQVEHLSRLVDDLLDVARITRGKIGIRKEHFDLVEVARRAVEDHRSLFVKGGIEIVFEPYPRAAWLYSNRVRISQVIGNLLQNSAKFTPSGGRVTISLELQAPGWVSLKVRDTGAGIAPDVLPRLFQPFEQGESTIDRSKGGLGLGLALVKGLVEKHGGSVSAASAGSGKGTEISVLLPLDQRAEEVVTPTPSVTFDATSRRVLVIEDNQDAADSLRDVLTLGQHEVAVAYSGNDGIEQARSFRPDIVLCDIGLPGMNGYEVARIIRADPALQDLRLVALTGYSAPEDIVKTQEAGFDSHMAKPPSIEALERLISELPY